MNMRYGSCIAGGPQMADHIASLNPIRLMHIHSGEMAIANPSPKITMAGGAGGVVPVAMEPVRGQTHRGLRRGAAIWVFPETAIVGRHRTEASGTTIPIRSPLSVQETGCGTGTRSA